MAKGIASLTLGNSCQIGSLLFDTALFTNKKSLPFESKNQSTLGYCNREFLHLSPQKREPSSFFKERKDCNKTLYIECGHVYCKRITKARHRFWICNKMTASQWLVLKSNPHTATRIMPLDFQKKSQQK